MKRFKELKQGDTIYYVRKNDRSGKMSLKKCTVDEVTPTGDKGFISGIPYERSYFIYASCGKDEYQFLVDVEASQNHRICTEPYMVMGLAEDASRSKIRDIKAKIKALEEKLKTEKEIIRDFKQTVKNTLN